MTNKTQSPRRTPTNPAMADAIRGIKSKIKTSKPQKERLAFLYNAEGLGVTRHPQYRSVPVFDMSAPRAIVKQTVENRDGVPWLILTLGRRLSKHAAQPFQLAVVEVPLEKFVDGFSSLCDMPWEDMTDDEPEGDTPVAAESVDEQTAQPATDVDEPVTADDDAVDTSDNAVADQSAPVATDADVDDAADTADIIATDTVVVDLGITVIPEDDKV